MFRTTLSTISTKLSSMKSENWGGVASMTGSLVALAAGDAESVASSISFFASEVSFIRGGHTSLGYSLGCAGLSLGDGLLCFSDATAGNPDLQITMGVLTGIWGISAMRYPIEQLGKVSAGYSEIFGRILQKAADFIPPVNGSIALMFRLPALYTAAFSGDHVNTVMLVSNSFWGASDVLGGRVQNFVKGPLKHFAIAADYATDNVVSLCAVPLAERAIYSLQRMVKRPEPVQ